MPGDLKKLLVDPVTMAQPACGMPPGRIAVGPVDGSPLGVPFVFTEEGNLIPHRQPLDPWGKVDIVGDEQCLSRGKPEDETLMAVAVVVILEQFGHHPAPLDEEVTLPVFEGLSQNLLDWGLGEGKVAVRMGKRHSERQPEG